MRYRRTVLAVLISAAAVIAADSSVQHASAGILEPALVGVAEVTDASQIELPLDDYSEDVADRQIVLRAEQSETAVCMHGFGLDFDSPSWSKDDLPDTPTHYRLYGLLDEGHAARMGYHAPGELPADEVTVAHAEHSSDFYNVVVDKSGGGVFHGQAIPPGGCIGQAVRDVEGTASRSDPLPVRLATESWGLANADTRVAGAFGAWSECMRRSGFVYSTPVDANNDSRWSGSEVSPSEIATALADVTCKKETNLVGIRMAVESAYQHELISAHAAELTRELADFASQVERARAVIASESGQGR